MLLEEDDEFKKTLFSFVDFDKEVSIIDLDIFCNSRMTK